MIRERSQARFQSFRGPIENRVRKMIDRCKKEKQNKNKENRKQKLENKNSKWGCFRLN